MMALERKLDVTANNIANIGTTGFRAHQLTFQEYLKPRNSQDRAGAEAEGPPSFVRTAFAYITPALGEVQQTGNPMDMAINGDAYFAIQTPDGERYTRDGSFSLDQTGQLVTLTGQPVLTDRGPLTVPREDGPISVNAEGLISTKQGVLGRLRLVGFSDPASLQAEGGNLLRSDKPPTEANIGAAQVLQGAIEHSNVQAVIETSRLSEIRSSYEQAAQLLKDSQNASALNKLVMVPD